MESQEASIAIVDYGAGNLTSVKNAFAALGVETVVTRDPAVVAAAARVVFPGVGAALSAMESLRSLGLESAVKDAAWIGFPVHKAQTVLGVDFKDGAQIWNAIIAIVPIALATIMEHIGDISAISSTVGKDFIKDPGLHRTLTGDGLATTFASLFGGPANTTYGENTGVLALSRVFNPVVVRIAAVFAILLSFCPKFAALIATIPGPIVGGISFVLYGMISAVGIRNLVENHVDFSKSRNLIIAAVILVTALGGVTLPITIGKFHATLTPLALASLAGIVLNAIFPAGDYAARAEEDEPPKGNTFEV